MSNIRLVLTTTKSIDSEYMLRVRGEIIYHFSNEYDYDIYKVGDISGYIFQYKKCYNSDSSIFEEFDSISQNIYDIHHAIFRSGEKNLKIEDELKNKYAIYLPNIFIIDEILINSEHRGKGYGKLAIEELLWMFYDYLFVLKPYPIELDKLNEEKIQRGIERLEKYYKSLGFERYKRSSIYYIVSS